jgi:hypothetical protein
MSVTITAGVGGGAQFLSNFAVLLALPVNVFFVPNSAVYN